MIEALKSWDSHQSGILWGLPEGVDALALLDLAARHSGQAVFIASDDASLFRMKASLNVLGVSDDSLLIFPAWDCLPYDRLSPNGTLVGQRVRALAALQAAPDSPRLILTTVNAWLQRVPPRKYFADASLDLTVHQEISLRSVMDVLIRNGYRRCETVRDVGECASRGDILDVFPPGYTNPVRLDFFDVTLDGIKSFDAETQRSFGSIDKIAFYPVGEFILDDASIAHFRSRYLERFGTASYDDTLYVSVSSGASHSGAEHFLPLFHAHLDSFADYIGAAPLLLDDDARPAAKGRLEQIDDFYTARMESLSESGSIWRPLSKVDLYLPDAGWDNAARPCHEISRFHRPEGDKRQGIDAGGRRGMIYHQLPLGRDKNTEDRPSFSAAVAEAIPALAQNSAVVLAASTEGARIRMQELIEEYLPPPHIIKKAAVLDSLPKGSIVSAIWPIEDGFRLAGLTVITEKDIYGSRIARPRGKRRRSDNFLREVSELNLGDLVVHIDHGIGRYEGLETVETGGAKHDCLLVIYAGGDKLFLPVENINMLSRYGRDAGDGQLDSLGSASWQSRKARVKGRIKDIALQLITVAAKRETTEAERICPDPAIYAEFCQRFTYAETEDQLEAINDVLGDLEAGHVMDRLICGDVGFGKTEVAMRAAFTVAMAGYQVAIVTPTTLLARQHGANFAERFKHFPIKIGVLSRMVGAKEANLVKKNLASGDCQIIIGTHGLLSKSLTYNNLGLVIVDEEQHFGVSQKEYLKSLRGDVHVLTLTATPIPRTLQLSLTGVRDMSIIATPPVDRLAVRTSVGAWDDVVLAEAIRRERFRNGQVFCVCPRIEHMQKIYERLLKMVGDAKIITAHGQMTAAELDKAMTQFGEGEGDILLSTNIIESGLDIPSANTIIIHRADMLGLSQLYQLRGRVGRGRHRAYAYLTMDGSRKITETAKKRLEVMQTLDALGAGFSLASYDLDIRGAGNLLGDAQSGHVREVGVELYQEMLKEAVQAAKLGESNFETVEGQWSPTINLGAAVLIPDDYVKDLTVRLSLYRRIAAAENEEDIDQLSAELIDRFGKMPLEVKNLFDTVAIKILCRAANVNKVDAGPKGISLSFKDNSFAKPEKLIDYIASKNGQIKLTPSHKLVLQKVLPHSERIKAVKSFMKDLSALAA